MVLDQVNAHYYFSSFPDLGHNTRRSQPLTSPCPGLQVTHIPSVPFNKHVYFSLSSLPSLVPSLHHTLHPLMPLTLLFQYVWLTQPAWLIWVKLLVVLVLPNLLMLLVLWVSDPFEQNDQDSRDAQRFPPSAQASSSSSSSSTSAPIHSHHPHHPHHPQDQDQDQDQSHTGPPPSYESLFGTEDLETVRARHPPRHPLNAPIPTDSPIEAAYSAGAHAFMGMVMATEFETHPHMIAARVAHAISVAASASNSQSYAALLAAASSVELLAMLAFEDECGHRKPHTRAREGRRVLNMIETAVRQSLAQAPPSTSSIPHYQLQSAGLVDSGRTPVERAFFEVVRLNPDLTSQL